MNRRIGTAVVFGGVFLLVCAWAISTALGALVNTAYAVSGQAQEAATWTPSVTLPPTITPSQTPPEPPATPTVTSTPTPGAHEYVVQAGDTCWEIAYRFGHVDPAAISAIEALNGAGACGSLRQGETLMVPRPTFTPTPVGADLTQTAVATAAPPQAVLGIGPSFAVQPYAVQPGDTLSSIAIFHDSSLKQICELNPLPGGIDCGACVWESPNCCCLRSITLSQGQTINVPAPTPTPTFTPTFTGSETPTATPTHRAPLPNYPQPGQLVRGPVRLAWVTAGTLAPDEHYLVSVRNESMGTVFSAVTRQLSFDIPAEYLPNTGESYALVWQVSVVILGEDGLFYPSGGVVVEQTFTWAGW